LLSGEQARLEDEKQKQEDYEMIDEPEIKVVLAQGLKLLRMQQKPSVVKE
jgi:hypothetical protein